jgi:hypothetical protein
MKALKPLALAGTLLAGAVFPAFTQETKPNPDLPAMKELSPGVFQIGKLRLDKNTKSIVFPGKINMSKDLVEYALVTPEGSTHEALLTTEIQPSDLHFAMLLLGAKGAGLLAPSPDQAPPGEINADYLRTAPRLKGDNLQITVKWKDKDDKDKSAPIEDLLMNPDTRKAAPRGPWIYTGSMFGADGHFLAQQQGTFVSVVTNPVALINNPRKGNDDDRAWAVNESATPAVNTPVEIAIKITDGANETK